MISDKELSALEEALKKLHTAYEKYFRGIERLEPVKDRDDFKKNLRRLLGTHDKNTARRFRLNTLQASLVTHEQYWNRICRQIEEGTFKRDKMRAEKLMSAAQPTAAPKADAPADAAAATADSASSAAPRPPPKSTEAAHPPAIQKLFAAFEQARLGSGGTAAPVSIDALAATVRKQAALLKERYKCRTVEFRVAIKDGKPILKALPKM